MLSIQVLLFSLMTFTLFAVVLIYTSPQIVGPPKRPLNSPLKTFDLGIVVQRGNKTFIPSLPSCNNEHLEILIVVCSAVENVGARQTIRSTWGSSRNLGPDVELRFLIGRSKDRLADSFIWEEKLDNSDIIHYDFLDTYLNLTLKTFVLLEWFSQMCNRSDYMMKVDDDTFVNIANLRARLKPLKHEKNFLLGYLVEDAKPEKEESGKFYIPDYMYNASVYPNYLSGSGYVMSSDVISELRQNALLNPFLPFEDVFFTGICTKRSNMLLIHSQDFAYLTPNPSRCVLHKLIIIHKLSSKLLHTVWEESHIPIDCSFFMEFLRRLI